MIEIIKKKREYAILKSVCKINLGLCKIGY